MGRVYAVVSAKGGVGKTTTTTNLAAALAASGADVAVVDGDLGMANLAGSLGVDSGGATLHDVLAGEADLADATREGPHGMTVVPGSPDLDAFARADPEGLRGVLDALRERYDYVLLDTGAGLSNDTVVPLTYVDEALLVSTTGRDALGDTEKTRQVAERLDIHVAGAVITRVDPDSPQNVTVGETLQTTVLSSIPDSTVVRDAGDAGEPLTTYAPGSSAAAAYRALAADLTGESVRTRDAGEGDEAGGADEGGDPSEPDDTSPVRDDEDIIVAGDHDADGDPADAETTEGDDGEAPTDPTDGDDVPDAASVEEEPLVAVDVSDETGPNRIEDADAAADDDPLIETAEPGEMADEADGRDVGEADAEAAEGDDGEVPADPTDGDDAPDVEGAESDSDGEDADDPDADDADADEEEGVYTTSLAGESGEEGEKKEKKGLFGRFLG